MVWAIDLDDFLGSFCNEGKYPLISELKRLLATNGKMIQKTFKSMSLGSHSYLEVSAI